MILRKRIKEHNKGLVFSTRRYMPLKLFYYEVYTDEKAVRQREKSLKYHGNSVKELKRRVGIS
ncbi:hypothetical protein C4546_01435 [Candidatus Parcubacteria bacterium]|nr:MAG: hypothetical protein C4546_01435 [Candidatus Parcubacteria bacterium]